MHRSLTASIAAVATGALLATAAPALAAPEAPAPATAGGQPAAHQYASQTLDWRPCTTDDLPGTPSDVADQLECATYQAPRDWNEPHSGDDITIAVSRLPARSTDAERSVLTNPGGPGAPGRSFPARFTERHELRAEYEVIGFDPRGTGMSANITCGSATSKLDPLDPRDRNPTNIERILNTTQQAVRACQRHSGELGPLINTFQTVHDIDLLRGLLDRERISWIGYSAGTWLGAHYAEMFTQHADRFVLDSAVEFTANWQESFAWQPRGFERRWRQDFLPWLAEHSDVYEFGHTGEDARQTYERLRSRLAEEPVELEGHEVGPAELDEVIVRGMYDKRAFPGLAEFLAVVRELVEEETSTGEVEITIDVLAHARATEPSPGPRPLVVGDRYEDAATASFWTIPCNETRWQGDRTSVRHDSARIGNQYPLLGWGWLSQPCIFWQGEPVELPTPTGQGVPPVLIVQSTHDPATPIEGAMRAHRSFAGSAMLTVVDEGDHGLYAGGNTCVDQHVEDYLVHNQPPRDSVCQGTPLPDPSG
ncbi:alpha/beta hydrolase [Haloechinothrix sp. LS1_15]|uniref:alpha/beta hydrolase n=1 Tax=Haloechinothrix sp. LS1_15 TaxID=2652248 RepID=UPI0029451B3B|nr:alpha/beta hydrolase [Haloechinothrix sp. LS1_15]MDV6011045.1 alpha/beta hydrolase [Haloechinothrix sp. LS1_15]